jgi:hypothetical protein
MIALRPVTQRVIRSRSSWTYASERRLVFWVATGWASSAGGLLCIYLDRLVPGYGRVLGAAVVCNLMFTAALLANRWMRRRDEARLKANGVLDQRERLVEELEWQWSTLDQTGLPSERLSEAKLEATREMFVRLARLGGGGEAVTFRLAEHTSEIAPGLRSARGR